MPDIRPVIRILGIILCVLAIAMLPSALIDRVAGHKEWLVFASASVGTLFTGLVLLLANRQRAIHLNTRQIYLATVLGWLIPCLFAALPFVHGATKLAFIDAFFEATSGLTTTGATVISRLERLPAGMLLWRAMLQWLGGIGIIVMAVAVLPVLSIGGMQMFRIEILSSSERAAPKAARVGWVILAVYVGLTAAIGVLLWLAGMRGFDALVHAMSTIATGGFSNYDRSIGHFRSEPIMLVTLFGMILGGMPFLLFFQFARGNWRAIVFDQQLRWYLGLMGLGGLAVAVWLGRARGLDIPDALLHGGFTVASVMTGTGFYTLDYSTWPGLPIAVLFFLTFVGGCAGSTAAGIKVFRFQFLFANALAQVRHLLRPHAIYLPTFNKKPIPGDVLESVMGFLFVYVLSFAVLAMALAALGLDFITAISGAASSISNVGPGLGTTIGPGSSFATLPGAAKLLLTAGMLLGRLEMFLVLVLFVPNFWRH